MLQHSWEWGRLPSQERQCRVLTCLSRMFLLRHFRGHLSFVNSSVGCVSSMCSPALPGINLLGFYGSLTQIIRNSLSQDTLPESRPTSRLISAPRCVNRMNSVFSFRLANTLLFHRNCVCVVVSEQADFTKLHELCVVVFCHAYFVSVTE